MQTQRFLRFFVTLSMCAGIAAGLCAGPQSAPQPAWVTPTTPWGHPDLQGILDGGSMTPLQRPERYANREFLTDQEIVALEAEAIVNPGRNARLENRFEDLAGAYNDVFTHRRTNYARTKRTSLIVDPPDGKIPPLAPTVQAARKQAAARAAAGPGRAASISTEARNVSFGVDADEDALVVRTGGFDGPEDRRNDRCLGIPMPATASIMRLVQAPDAVMLYYEYAIGGGAYRTVHLDGRPHLPPHLRQKYGDSVGRWEGDTLVVDSTNFSRETVYQGSSEHLHLIERFTRVAKDLILYRITADDPTTWTRPWTQEVPLTILSNTENKIYESACNEGNYSMIGILAGARELEKEQASKTRKR